MQRRASLTTKPPEEAAESSALRTAAIALLVCGVAAAIVVARSERSVPPRASVAATEISDRSRIADDGVPEETSSPPPAPFAPTPPPPRSAPTTATSLADALATGTDFEKIAAIDAAVDAGDRSALEVLGAVDLKEQPGVAPKIIHGLAALASKSSPRDRAKATGTLATWLKDETSRRGRDAEGNVVNLVEALGEAGDPGSVDALTDALDERRLGLPVETLAVQQLGSLGDRRAEGSVARLMARLQAMSPSEDAFDEQLRREAIAAAQTFLEATPR